MRVTTIGSSGKTAPVHRARCSRTQQLSGPLTEMNRCVTSQLVVPVGTEVTVAEVGEEDPLHAANVNATARPRSGVFKASLWLDQDYIRVPHPQCAVLHTRRTTPELRDLRHHIRHFI